MKNKNQVWIGTADKNNEEEFEQLSKEEFISLPIVEALSDEEVVESTGGNRRDFLKLMGFSLGAATIAAGCETPVRHAIPYVTKPDAIVPGVATYYASSFVNGGDYAAVLVKTREGRPIKIEGNSMSTVTKGGTGAKGQALVLSLYDSNRLKEPAAISANEVQGLSWEDLDKQIRAKLGANDQIRIVTHTEMSPTTKRVFEAFAAKYPNTKVVTYDPISCSALLEANQADFGQAVVPNYHFNKAKVIVSFAADFLGTWISAEEYSVDYVKNRVIKNAESKMSRHIQVESGMSVTGSNADNRILIRPSEMGGAIALLASELGVSTSAPKINDKATQAIKKIARELQANRGNSLVISGSNNLLEQRLVNAINNALGNYGSSITFDRPSYQRQGIDKNIRTLVKEMNAGSVDALLVWNANPAFDIPEADKFKTGAAKVGLKVSFAESLNETAAICDYVAPAHHNLEKWGDVEPKRNSFSIIQPTIAPLYNTRQGEESLLKWAGNSMSYYDFLKKSWEEEIFPMQSEYMTFQAFWDNSVHDGVLDLPSSSTASAYGGAPSGSVKNPSSSELEADFYEMIGMGSGQYANNPWLQEMPDPVMRTVWGNYLAVPIKWDGINRFEGLRGTGSKTVRGIADIVEFSSGSVSDKFSVVPQFGQTPGTVSIGLGYGRTEVGKVGQGIGINVFPCLGIDANGNTEYFATDINVGEVVDYNEEFGCVQYHHTYGVTGEHDGKENMNLDEVALSRLLVDGYQGSLTDRTVLFQDNLANVGDLMEKIKEKRAFANHLNDKTLYPFEEYSEKFYSQGHHWGMHIDMNACFGCAACTVACMAENNIPVVGNKEVSRHHEMTWLRIDRYYYGDAENPNVAYMPMMCQHCDNAPCENVCPVNATNHSSEGLNQMAYNRCIGTRYCANNCPYKVRRFNWLDYTSADLFGVNQNSINGEDPAYYTDNIVRMVLNPDVTVRSRGVIEKCSLCAQRLQQGKLAAKAEGRKLREEDVKTACQTACPTGAITFGDRNDSNGSLSKAIKNPLVYRALEEINVQSSIFYQAKVNNRSEALDA